MYFVGGAGKRALIGERGCRTLFYAYVPRNVITYTGQIIEVTNCYLVSLSFSRYNLVAHSKSHTSDGAPASTPATAATPPPPRRRLFRCNFCQERFERRYMLERHVSVVHGRTLERPPPTPRNTMSKMLKAQAQARRSPTHSNETTTKEEPTTDPSDKLPSSSNAWTNAYVQEFGLRPEYQH